MKCYDAAVFVLLLSLQLQAQDKMAIPPLEEMKNKTKDIYKEYESDYSKKSAEDKLALAEKFLKRAGLSTESAALRYVLYCEVMTLAAQSESGEAIYFAASEGRSKTFVTPDTSLLDKAIGVTVKKTGVFQYDTKDYSTVAELVESLKKNEDGLNIILVSRDAIIPQKTGAQFWRAMAEAGFSRLMFKDGNANYTFIDDLLLHVGILEKAVGVGIEMIAENKIHDAMNEIRVGINCFPNDPKSVSAECIALLDKNIAQEEEVKKKAALLVYRAVILLSEIKKPGNADKAIGLLNEAEKNDGNLPEIYNTRAACRMFLKESEKALPDIEKAIALNPNYPDAIQNRSRANLAIGNKEVPISEMEVFEGLSRRLDSKISELSEAVRLQPKIFKFWIRLSSAQHQRGLLKEALSTLDSADKLFADTYEVASARSHIYWQLGKLEQSLASAKQALELKPDSEYAAILCALVYCEKGDFDNSEKYYNVAIPISKHLDNVYYDRAFVYFYQGDLDRANEDCSSALKANESYLPALFLRARICRMKGKTAEADVELRKILKSTANNYFDLAVIGCARAATGDFEGAFRASKLVKDARPFDRWMDFNAAVIYCIRAASPTSETKEADITEAIILLGEAAKEGMKNWSQIQSFPEIQILKDDARFQELIKKQ